MCTSSIQMLRSTRVGDRGRREGRGGGGAAMQLGKCKCKYASADG